MFRIGFNVDNSLQRVNQGMPTSVPDLHHRNGFVGSMRSFP